MFRLLADILAGREQARELRFNRSYITVSELAQQLYCEYKIDLAHREGKIETEEKVIGTQIHEEVFRGRRVSIEDIVQLVLERETLLFTMPLALVYRGVPIVGIPDALLAERGLISAVIELKTTSRWLSKVFPCEYFQANLYAYMLRKWGLTSSDCKVIIVKLSRKNVDLTLSNRERILSSVLSKIRRVIELSCSEYFVVYRRRNLSIHCYDVDDVTVERFLEWALGYWKGTRPIAVPSTRSKCMRCEYKHLCEYYRGNESRRDILTQQMG